MNSIPQYSDKEKVAIILNILSENDRADIAKKIFSFMRDHDVIDMIELMGTVKKVPIHHAFILLKQFYLDLQENKFLLFGSNQTMIKDLLEDQRISRLFGGSLSFGKTDLSLTLKTVNDTALIDFCLEQHPQIVAVIFSFLERKRSSEILVRLPQKMQTEVIERVASISHISESELLKLDELLKESFLKIGRRTSYKLGGIEQAAGVVAKMDNAQNILQKISVLDQDLASQIQSRLFQFKDLAKANNQGIQAILKEFSHQDLAKAFKLADPDVQEKFYSNMSSRSSKILKEDLATQAPIKKSEVLEVQSRILSFAKELMNHSILIIGDDKDEYV